MSFDPYEIIIKPVSSEAAFSLMEERNTLVFIVRRNANKKSIKKAIESLLNVRVVKVNTLITPSGKKKAYVRLSPEYNALDIATKMGIF
ncbi:MAG: 50S ribosomal protein L23 [Candidatus Asgardarchaeia archaeon]